MFWKTGHVGNLIFGLVLCNLKEGMVIPQTIPTFMPLHSVSLRSSVQCHSLNFHVTHCRCSIS